MIGTRGGLTKMKPTVILGIMSAPTDHRPPARDEILARLAGHDIAPTQQRVEIAQALFARPQHLCADQVLALVNRDGEVVSKATVYNTLGLFARRGLVREVVVDPNRLFYDTTTHRHHHFFNVDTGELTDIPEGLPEIARLPPLPEGVEALGVEVIIRIRGRRQ